MSDESHTECTMCSSPTTHVREGAVRVFIWMWLLLLHNYCNYSFGVLGEKNLIIFVSTLVDTHSKPKWKARIQTLLTDKPILTVHFPTKPDGNNHPLSYMAKLQPLDANPLTY